MFFYVKLVCQQLKQLKLSENFLDVHPAEMRTKLKDVCRTRWLERLDGFDRIWDLYEPILVTLDHIGSNLDGTYQAICFS